jgi:Rieske 2Fe-2S family protein
MTTSTGAPASDPHAALAAAWEPPGTLLGRDYASEDVFELERRRIFHAGWFCVGRAEDAAVAGAFFVADVAGESLLIVRGEDGLLRGFLNVCRHRGSQLCDGVGEMRTIRCPYHAWSYHLDGRLRATPNVRGDEQLPREQLGLIGIRLVVWEGFVWICLADEGPSLEDHLTRWADSDPFQWARYGVDGLVTGVRREYRVRANWKLLVENYNECLHCPNVHPQLARLVPVFRAGEVEDQPGQLGNALRDGSTSFTDAGGSELPTLPGVEAEDLGKFYGVTLLPNLIINYTSDTVSTFLLLPRHAEETNVVCHYLFRPETVAAADFDPSEVVEFRHELALQDWEVCERAQRGAHSRGYADGGILPYADRLLHDFHRRYRAMLAASGGPE